MEMVPGLSFLPITTCSTKPMYFRPTPRYLRSTTRKYFGSSVVLNFCQCHLPLITPTYSYLLMMLNVPRKYILPLTAIHFKMTFLACLFGAFSGIYSLMKINVFYSDFVPRVLFILLTILQFKFSTAIEILEF